MPLYKGRGNREDCNSYRSSISLISVPGKIYEKVVDERMTKKTDNRVGDEQGDFRKGRGYVDQTLANVHRERLEAFCCTHLTLI